MLTRLLKKIKIFYFKILIFFGWDYQTKIVKMLMGESLRKESFRYLIEALSQKHLSRLLELEIDGCGGVLHLIAMYSGNSDILSILIEKMPQRTLFKLLQEREENGYTPFQLAALYNLKMVLFLIKKMSSDQLYTLLTIGRSYQSIPINDIILQHEKSRTEISKNVVNALVEKLLDSQFFSLISTQLKFTKVCNGSTGNLILTVKVIPKTSRLSNDSQLCTMNELKKQMLKQLCFHLQYGEDHPFPHTELYDDNSSLRIFFVQMKSEELYQMKDYDGFISSKGLLPMILNHNKLEFESSYAVSRAKCFEFINMEKRYGYTFYHIAPSDHFTMLISMDRLHNEVYRNIIPKCINDVKSFLDSSANRKMVVPSSIKGTQTFDIGAVLLSIIRGHNTLRPKEELEILEYIKVKVESNTYRIDLHSLVNLFMPLISNKKAYREQVYVDGNWVGHRALANIEEVSTNENKIVEKGKKIYTGSKALIKYKNRMYEYQAIPCLGAEKIELLMDMGLFIPYIEPLSNLYLQSIDLSNQEYCKQQKALAKQFIESGKSFSISRKNLISMFSKVFKVVFPRNGLDKMTIGLLLFHNRSLSYTETAFCLSAKLDPINEEYCLLLNRKAEDIMAYLNEFTILYKKIEDLAIDLCGEEIATELKENNDALGFLNALAERINDLIWSSPFSCLQYSEHIFAISNSLHKVEKIEDKIECYQDLLNNLLLSVDINKKTVHRFINDDFQVSRIRMIMRLYCHLESNSEVRAETIKNLKQYSGGFFSTQDDFQNSCHEIIHQIFGQICKQSKGEQSVNSELTGPSTSALSQETLGYADQIALD